MGTGTGTGASHDVPRGRLVVVQGGVAVLCLHQGNPAAMGVSSSKEITLFTVDGAADGAADESNQEMDLCLRGREVGVGCLAPESASLDQVVVVEGVCGGTCGCSCVVQYVFWEGM